MSNLLARLFACIILISVPSTLFASLLLQDNFVRTGQTESLVDPLAHFGGVTTTQQWSGLIEISVSGQGINNPPQGYHVDPFWAWYPSDPNTVVGTGHRFRLAFDGCAVSAVECHAPDIVLFMTFVDGVGFVSPPNVPSLDPIPLQEVMPILQGIVPYTTSHAYRFVVDVGPTSRFLTLGDGDGGVWDNSGEYDIQLFGVSARPVPEPATMLLFGTGLAIFAAWGRRKTV